MQTEAEFFEKYDMISARNSGLHEIKGTFLFNFTQAKWELYDYMWWTLAKLPEFNKPEFLEINVWSFRKSALLEIASGWNNVVIEGDEDSDEEVKEKKKKVQNPKRKPVEDSKSQ